MSGPQSPHFVMVPVGLFGHIFPMIQLAVQLTSVGNKVTFITTHRTKNKTLMALDSTLSELEQPDRVHNNLLFLSLDDLADTEELDRGGGQGIWANIIWMSTRTSEVQDLVTTAVSMQGPLTCMILDFLTLHLKEIADHHSAHIAPFWTPPAGFLLISLHLKELINRGLAPLTPSNALSLISDIQGLPELCVYRDLPFAFQQDIDFSFMHRSNQVLLEAPFVIVNTVHGLESVAIRCVRELGVKLVSIGPLVPLELSTSPQQEEADVFKWLDSKPALSVLYICFGTLAEFSEEQLQQLSSALEESGLNFLWVLRTGNVRNSGSVQSSDAVRNSGRGMVVPWCCQVKALKHPAVGGFLTHCGWNSILESLCSGVPMIGWPCIAEQNLNCKYVVDVWRVGSRIVPNNEDGSIRVVKKGEILHEINKVMVGEDGAAMRKRAQELKQLAGRSVQSSLTNLIFGLLEPLVKNRVTC